MSLHEIEIETVAEVVSVAREAVTIYYFDDQRIINLMAHGNAWRDIQSISFPVEKAPEIIAAIQAIFDVEGPAR